MKQIGVSFKRETQTPGDSDSTPLYGTTVFLLYLIVKLAVQMPVVN